MELLNIIRAQIFSPLILFFALGIVAALARSDLKIPKDMSTAMSIFLLCSIGLKGGVGIAEAGIGAVLAPALAATVLGVGIVLLGYAILTKLNLCVADAGAIAGHYGAVAMVAVVASFIFLNRHEVPFEEFILATYPFMANSAIISAIFLVRFSLAKHKKEKGAPVRILDILKLCLFNRGIVLLVPALIIGWIVGSMGTKLIMPFFEGMFSVVLYLFMLDMGLLVAGRLHEWKVVGPRLLVYAIIIPPIHGILGVFLGTWVGLSVGGATILGVMAGSASFIEAPVALRSAIPEANSSLSLTASVALTFPLTIIIGIPLYYAIARMLG